MARRVGRSHIEWYTTPDGTPLDVCTLEVLMDIREHLKAIRSRLDCVNTLRIPHYLATIASNTKRRRRRGKRNA